MIAGLEDREYHARWRATHREQHRAAARKSYAKHRAKNVARAMAWNAANPAKYKATTARYAKRHPEKRAEWTQRWRDKNPERTRAANLKRANARWAAHPELRREGNQRWRARRRATTMEPITAADWSAVCEQFGHRCAYCFRADAPLTQDHVEPLSRGGAHVLTNVVPACFSCNAKKHAMPLLTFLLRRRT